MTQQPYDVVQASDASKYIRENPDMLVLDVRTDEEWEGGHIPGASHISIQDLPDRWEELPEDRSVGIICICALGGRSAAACDFLAEQGYTRLINVIGGMNGYTGETIT